MESETKKWLIAFTLAIVVSGLLFFFFPPEPQPPREPVAPLIEKAAAEATEAAGKHFTRGVIEAVKEELSKPKSD